MADTNNKTDGWMPKNKPKTDAETPFTYFGTAPKRDTVLVYGVKAEATAENPKPREPQSRRAVNTDTLAKMLRGECGAGTPGVDALLPLPNGRDVVNVQSYGEEGSPFREQYLEAAKVVFEELGDEAPDWLKEEVVEAVGQV